MDDEAALENIRNGGKQGYTILYKRYIKSLRYYVMLTHHVPEQSVDDVLQEIFLKFYKSIATFKGQCRVKNWLYLIANSMAKEYWRKEKVYDKEAHQSHTISIPNETNDEHLEEEPDLDSLLYQSLYQEQSQTAHNALYLQIDLEHSLAQLKRESNDFLLNCLNALTLLSQKQSIEDIASQIGRTAVATRQYLYQCKKKLRQHPLFRQFFEELDN
jgi:RNA polymerase sigma factor (sigma-70 family)